MLMSNKSANLLFFTFLVLVLFFIINRVNRELFQNDNNKIENNKIENNKIENDKLTYKSDDFSRYREKVSVDIKNKELNRDFNYEIPMFYKYAVLFFPKICIEILMITAYSMKFRFQR